MNLNGIINMITRMLVQRAAKWGMGRMDRQLSGRSTARKGAPARDDALTPAERKARGDARAAAKRARQAARITRRLK